MIVDIVAKGMLAYMAFAYAGVLLLLAMLLLPDKWVNAITKFLNS